MRESITIRLAKKADKRQIKNFYKTNKYSASFMGYDTSYIALADNRIIACVILSYISKNNNQALLHALYVENNYRIQGIAKELVSYAKREHKSVACFALNTTSDFYYTLNFNQIQKDMTDLTTTGLLSTINIEKYVQYKKHIPNLSAFVYTHL